VTGQGTEQWLEMRHGVDLLALGAMSESHV